MSLPNCPCCGHRAELREERTDYGDWYTIECLGCGLMIDGSDKQEIIDAWTRRRTDGMIRWLDAEIEKCNESRVSGLSIRRGSLLQCKKQLVKLLDGMGVQE